MSLYIGREASKLWKRLCAETKTEINLLLENWMYLLAGIVFQYIHGLAARGVHYFHRPGPVLQDVGFFLLPELGQDRGYISETVFTCIFASFVLWTFHPFIFKVKKIYTVLIWCRVLAFLVACQFLRILSFYSTQLPGPNYHCREGSKLARLPRPDNTLEVLLINFPRGVLYGCGDLIFSSHMIFSLVFVRFMKQLAWLIVVIQSLLIVASRKHYTVDVVVAWYTVNLVVFFIDKKLPELLDRGSTTLFDGGPSSNSIKDPLKLHQCPMTRARSKTIKNALNALVIELLSNPLITPSPTLDLVPNKPLLNLLSIIDNSIETPLDDPQFNSNFLPKL